MNIIVPEYRNKQFWLFGGIVSGVLIGALAIVITVLIAGGGHGSYIPAKLFFPYTMLSTFHFGIINLPFVVLAIVQFPLYGAVIGIAGGRGKTLHVSAVIALVHLIVAVMCFLMLEGGSFDP